MLNTITLVISLIMALMVLVIAGTIIRMTYKKAPAKEQRQIKAQNHDAFLKAIQIAKSLAKTEVINVARDENLPSGAGKKNKAVTDIIDGLKIAGFSHIPEVVVEKIVEASYQTLAQFIKANHIDSRMEKTPLPNNMNPSDLKKRLP